MQFQIRGRLHELKRQDVLERTKNAVPALTDGRNKYFVRLHDRDYPIKQVLELVINRPVAEFTAHTAYRVLTKLDFEVTERSISGSESTRVSGSDESSVDLVVTFEMDEDGWVVSSCPSLPGCHSQGRTKKEASENIQEAIRGYLASMRDREEPMPSSTDYAILRVAV